MDAYYIMLIAKRRVPGENEAMSETRKIYTKIYEQLKHLVKT